MSIQCLPIVSPIVEFSMREMSYHKHTQAMTTKKPIIDITHPPSVPRLVQYEKRIKKERKIQMTTENQNIKLIREIESMRYHSKPANKEETAAEVGRYKFGPSGSIFPGHGAEIGHPHRFFTSNSKRPSKKVIIDDGMVVIDEGKSPSASSPSELARYQTNSAPHIPDQGGYTIHEPSASQNHRPPRAAEGAATTEYKESPKKPKESHPKTVSEETQSQPEGKVDAHTQKLEVSEPSIRVTPIHIDEQPPRIEATMPPNEHHPATEEPAKPEAHPRVEKHNPQAEEHHPKTEEPAKAEAHPVEELHHPQTEEHHPKAEETHHTNEAPQPKAEVDKPAPKPAQPTAAEPKLQMKLSLQSMARKAAEDIDAVDGLHSSDDEKPEGAAPHPK